VTKINAVEHVGLVFHALKTFPSRRCAHLDIDNVLGEGFLALAKAAQDYRGERGASFANFALICIRGAMAGAWSAEWNVRQCRAQTAPVADRRWRRKLKLFGELGYKYFCGLAPEFARVDSATGERDRDEDIRLLLAGPLAELSVRCRKAFEWRCGGAGERGQTFREIARQLNVSPARARQLDAKAVRSIRKHLESNGTLAAAKELAGVCSEGR
jgi:RNA polymerase sigma factor (sigma-70 family)